jgi:hypothetical protein
MTVCGKTFHSLTDYLEWLYDEWHGFEEKLYTLEEYLGFGEYMWLEVWCLPEVI